MKKSTKRIKVGVSACLLGEKVRWNGGDKRNALVKEMLKEYFDSISVCPEVEAGMGVPREPIHLSQNKGRLRLLGNDTGDDWTARMSRYSKKRIKMLSAVSGFIFKEGSPSCGIDAIPITSVSGDKIEAQGQGYFAQRFMATYPLTPVIDEKQLCDAGNRERFIVRVSAYYHLQTFLRKKFTREALARFHASNKYLILAHSKTHYQAMSQLVDGGGNSRELKIKYSQLFMAALACKSTLQKNAYVLKSMVSKLTGGLEEKRDLRSLIVAYENNLAPISLVAKQIKDCAKRQGLRDLQAQTYLEIFR